MLYSNTLAKALLLRRTRVNYEKTRLQNEQLFSPNQQQDDEYFNHLHEHKYIDFQYATLFNPMESSDNLQVASDYLDYSFLIRKLRYLIAQRNYQRILKIELNNQNEQAFLDFLAHFPLDKLPLIQAYYLVLKLFQSSTFKQFSIYKQHLFSIRNQFDRNEIRQLLTLGGNICFWNIQNAQLEFLDERFAITKIMVEENFLQVLGHFSNNHFRTTLRDAIEAGELEWAKWFLETKLPITHPDHRTNLDLLGWASLYFAKGELDKQKEYLIQMQSEDYKFTDFYNELIYRVLRLKTDYTLLGNAPKKRAREAFQSHLQSYLRYCERKTDIPATTRQSRINFGLAIRLIFNKRYGKKRISKDLQTEILGLKPITELPWLLGQVWTWWLFSNKKTQLANY